MFYGESMFSRRSNASKVAFAHLIRQLTALGVELIDCQMYTDHLASLGGREIPRSLFIDHLHRWTAAPVRRDAWSIQSLNLNW
jgi:leucyl/phenylalanyl-tRNA--protein transferase